LNKESISYFSKRTDPEKLERLTMGIDFNQFHNINRNFAKDNLNLDKCKKYILYSGALVKRKGLDYLIQAFHSISISSPECILILKGEGYYKSILELQIKKLGLTERVIFIDWVEQNDLALYYNSADICVLPSTDEGLGIVALEALACNTPFIGSNVGGIRDLVEVFGAGILVPPKNPDALVDSLKTILENRYNLNGKREKAKRIYDWNRIAKRNLEIYDVLWSKYYG